MTEGVSVIIPAFNNGLTIKNTLQSLLQQEVDIPVEIIVIDDCSTDETVEIPLSLGLKVFRNPLNLGLAASLNRGISLSKNEVVVTLHADATPLSEKWLLELTAPLIRNDADAACSLQYPPVFDPSRLALWEKLLWGRLGPHHALNDKADAYKRTVLERIGPFDQERFRTAGEDEDMALRLRLNGMRITQTSAGVRHDHVFLAKSGREVLFKIMLKEYAFGKCGGALRRKYPRHRPGAYVYPSVKSPFNDGAFRTFLCLGSLIPFIQLVCIPGLVVASCVGIISTSRHTNVRLGLWLYPFFNLARFWSYTLGYLLGLITGRQS